MSLRLLLLTLCFVATSSSAVNSSCLSGAEPFRLSASCDIGWYCPLYNVSDPLTYPVQCPPTNECLVQRLTAKFCGPQGTYEPTLCEKGYYCPTVSQKVLCPQGHYCPIGQYQPTRCGSMTQCPAGSSTKKEFSSILAVIVTDVVFIVLWFALKRWKRRSIQARTNASDQLLHDVGSVNPSLYAKGAMYHQLPPHSKRLCQGFKRAQRQLPPMRLEFDQLSLTIPGKNGAKNKTVLAGVTGTIEPGKVTAVMGPSGAGKTTFLNSMMGKVDSSWIHGGSLRINGVEQQLSKFRKIIGYVPQEDIMHRELTIHDNISYSANIRLPCDWTIKQREDHINSVIAAMQLAHVQDSPIGDELTRGVSGGQRKRCNIGMEVAAAPSLLLLDEPTSGLDSTSAMEICKVLKDLARVSSLTVVMVIHQPRVEIWNQLDELLLLAPGGVTVYQGPQRLALSYFSQRLDVHVGPNENPADALMDCIGAQGDEFVKYWMDGGKQYVTLLEEDAKRQGHVVDNGPLEVPDEDFDEDEDDESSADKKDDMKAHVTRHEPAVPLSPVVDVKIDTNQVSGPISAAEAEVVHVHPRAKSDDLPDTKRPAAFTSAPVRYNASFLQQTMLAFRRSLWKQVAMISSLALEVGLGFLAGALMGASGVFIYQGVLKPPYTILSPTPIETAIGATFFYMGLSVSLAAASAGVRVFSEEQAIYRREVAAGHSHLAYYIGVSVAQMPRLFLDALHFAFIYHILSQPLTSFGEFLPLVFNLYVAVYGLAAIVSMLVSRTNAALLAVVLSLYFSSMTAKGGQPEGLQRLSASRWAVEALFDLETTPYLHIMQVYESTAPRLGYELGKFHRDVGVMFVIGILYRVIAYVVMLFVDRKLFASSSGFDSMLISIKSGISRLYHRDNV